MKVSNSNLSNSLKGIDSKQLTDLNSTAKAKQSEKLDSSDASAKLSVSSEAMLMQKAKSIASDDSIDEAKVARLQKLIDEGNYNVDASAIADRLVDEHMVYES